MARCVSLFGLFHVREILQTRLRACVLNRRQTVFVDFVRKTWSFFQTFHSSNSLIDSLIHQKNRFVKCAVCMTTFLSAAWPRVRQLMWRVETHVSDGVECRPGWA